MKDILTPWQKLEKIFIERGKLETFNKKDIIISQNEELRNVLMVREGLVRGYDIDDVGRESTVAFLSRYNAFPLSWLQNKPNHRTILYYEAFKETTCYVVNRNNILDEIKKDPDLLMFLLNIVNTAYLNGTGRILNLMHSKLSERVEYILYYLAARLGEQKGSVFTIPYAFSHEDIAKMVGASREAVSVEMAIIKQSGFYTKLDHSLQIDISKSKSDIHAKQSNL